MSHISAQLSSPGLECLKPHACKGVHRSHIEPCKEPCAAAAAAAAAAACVNAIDVTGPATVFLQDELFLQGAGKMAAGTGMITPGCFFFCRRWRDVVVVMMMTMAHDIGSIINSSSAPAS